MQLKVIFWIILVSPYCVQWTSGNVDLLPGNTADAQARTRDTNCENNERCGAQLEEEADPLADGEGPGESIEDEQSPIIQQYSGTNYRKRYAGYNGNRYTERPSRGRGHGHENRHGHETRKPKKTKVDMPDGTTAYITNPNPKNFKCGTPATFITLSPTGTMSQKEYKIVSDVIQACSQNVQYNILKIEKVINGCLWKRYRSRQQIVHQQSKVINERMLFHGTNQLQSIVDTGFDERYARVGQFGSGVYFSPISSLSHGFITPNAQGEKRLLLCRVTLGKTETAATGNTYAHAKPGFNSVEGNQIPNQVAGRLQFYEYIVYIGEQAYPEYIITYT